MGVDRKSKKISKVDSCMKKTIKRGGGFFKKLGFKSGKSSKQMGPTQNSIQDAKQHLQKQMLTEYFNNNVQTNNLNLAKKHPEYTELQRLMQQNTLTDNNIETITRIKKSIESIASGISSRTNTHKKATKELEEHAERFVSPKNNNIIVDYLSTGLQNEAGQGYKFIEDLDSKTAKTYLTQYRTPRQKAMFIRNLMSLSNKQGKISKNDIHIIHRKTLMNVANNATQNKSTIPTLQNLGVSKNRIHQLKTESEKRLEEHKKSEEPTNKLVRPNIPSINSEVEV